MAPSASWSSADAVWLGHLRREAECPKPSHAHVRQRAGISPERERRSRDSVEVLHVVINHLRLREPVPDANRPLLAGDTERSVGEVIASAEA